MPQIVIVAATKAEVQILLDHFSIFAAEEKGLFSTAQGPDLKVLITGVGMVETAFMMGKHYSELGDIVINAGICGAFSFELQKGELVNVSSDSISELGAEDDKTFIPYTELGLGGNAEFHANLPDNPLINSLRRVKGITVNTVHGNEENIQKIISRLGPGVESMEGAAFLRACSGINGKYVQIRAVSNYVEKRDRSKWDIPAAIRSLNEFLIKLLKELDE